ncbi:hypothetical protein JVT61DRAFT_9952 [Boletus reticuloceps]|uniref:Uncharacterized protein n=1 Tax=Boletus reticuloceps TaxID=495285 RepID=A0A8I2YFX2_9AGAM|nr:hypothetical protein JVT61DRAFT_9952 [Boletus reticuloceps]
MVIHSFFSNFIIYWLSSLLHPSHNPSILLCPPSSSSPLHLLCNHHPWKMGICCHFLLVLLQLAHLSNCGLSFRLQLGCPTVCLKEGENGYMGKTPISSVDSERLTKLHRALASIPIVYGDPVWNSHNWVMEGRIALRNVEGYHIDKYVTSEWVVEQLGGK